MIRKLVKKLIPKKLLSAYSNRKKNTRYLNASNKFSKFAVVFKKKVYWLFSSTRLTSNLYYLLFSRAFNREQNQVLKGKFTYLKSLESPIKSQVLLRRNTHRLEKGLLMIPRRSIFALDYITETVDALDKVMEVKISNSSSVDEGEVKWAFNVLEEYFSATSEHEIINSAKQRFKSIKKDYKDTVEIKYVPYKRLLDEKRKSIPSFDQIAELAKFRRSVRWFEQKNVPRVLVDKAIEIGGYAPSACNRQPYEFRIIDDPELVKNVVSLPKGTSGYNHNIPMIIVVVGKLDAYFSERDRHLIYIDSSLASMSLVFALETLGLSSCCINWPDIEHLEKRMEKVLKLESHERPVMCLAVGYAAEEGMVAYSKKKSLDNIRRYN